MLEDLRRAVPLAVACRCAGLSVDAVQQGMAHQPEAREAVDVARAHGERYLLTDTTLDARDRQWRLERLYPKTYHLPTKVTGVAPEDGGAPIGTEVRVTLELARVAARDDHEGPMPVLPSGRDGT